LRCLLRSLTKVKYGSKLLLCEPREIDFWFRYLFV
jgi:hypothetical protein